MSKPINFGLLLITLGTLHATGKGMLVVKEPVQSNEELIYHLRNKVLERSNDYRKKHGLQPFTINEEMNDRAQKWANSLAKTGSEFKHDPENAKYKYGENLAKTPALTNLGARVIDLWYSFMGNVNVMYGVGGYNGNTQIRPMTQLLWKSSTQIGVGVSQNDVGDYFVVVYYYPQGNIDHWYNTNLPTFNVFDVVEAQYKQESFNMKQKKSIIVSNLRRGTLQLSQETGKYKLPTLPEEYNSFIRPIGLSEFEASSIRKQVLERHNFYRNNHGMNSLKITAEINRYAQRTANVNRDRDNLESMHSKQRIYGENKYKTPPIIYGEFGETVVDIWYSQIYLMRENMHESGFCGAPKTGCLTQMLWKESKEIGVGVSVGEDGIYNLVVNYDPTGNVKGCFRENLPTFTKSEIKSGEEANAKLIKLAGEETNFIGPTWLLMRNPELPESEFEPKSEPEPEPEPKPEPNPEPKTEPPKLELESKL